jgi:hypothetical protein
MSSHPSSVHCHWPLEHVQVLQPSPAGFVAPSVHAGAGQRCSLHDHAPFAHTQVLHPSSAGLVAPVVHAGGGHARLVHAQAPPEHVQVLQPSSAGFVAGSQAGLGAGHDADPSQSGWSFPCTAVFPEHASKPTGTHINHQIRDAMSMSKARRVPGPRSAPALREDAARHSVAQIPECPVMRAMDAKPLRITRSGARRQ